MDPELGLESYLERKRDGAMAMKRESERASQLESRKANKCRERGDSRLMAIAD